MKIVDFVISHFYTILVGLYETKIKRHSKQVIDYLKNLKILRLL